jgi:hypothetical protein
MRVDKVADFVEAKACELMARAHACMTYPSRYMKKKYRYKHVTFTLEVKTEDPR